MNLFFFDSYPFNIRRHPFYISYNPCSGSSVFFLPIRNATVVPIDPLRSVF